MDMRKSVAQSIRSSIFLSPTKNDMTINIRDRANILHDRNIDRELIDDTRGIVYASCSGDVNANQYIQVAIY
jgi:hypothetical protein